MTFQIARLLKDDKIIESSFYVAYSLLFTTGTITLIESWTTNEPKIRHIMNIETCISIIAAYFYGNFITMIKSKEVNYKDLTIIRYTDWFISTPLMILALLLVLSYNLNISLKFTYFLIPVILDLGMLIFGYLGEIGKINKNYACLGGFILFTLMFYFIYYYFIRNKKSVQNIVVYLVFLIVWSIYGIAYLANEKIKNITYNILDVIAKCFVGIGLWAYLTKIFA